MAQTRSVYFSKCLISIYFFYTPASAKAETCPAWWNDREFIYFPQQPLLGEVTGGHYCTGLIAAAAAWVLLHFGWMFKSGVLLHMHVSSNQISIYSEKKNQNINNASGFLSFLATCFEYDCPPVKSFHFVNL